MIIASIDLKSEIKRMCERPMQEHGSLYVYFYNHTGVDTDIRKQGTCARHGTENNSVKRTSGGVRRTLRVTRLTHVDNTYTMTISTE